MSLLSMAMSLVFSPHMLDNDDDGGGGGGGSYPPADPPGSPRTRTFEGPWLQQQLILSLVIGVTSFLAFCALRRKYTALFAPRTKLKGFSPHEAHSMDRNLFGWIWPTVKAGEIAILQIIGLDAAVLLGFFKMAFWLFFFLSLWSCAVLMPINYSQNGSIDGVDPSEDCIPGNETFSSSSSSSSSVFLTTISDNGSGRPSGPLPWLDLSAGAETRTAVYHTSHLLSTYLFSLLALRALWKNYHKFIRSRQLYVLELLHSIPARTVEIKNLPTHLRSERALAEYFEGLGLTVESVSVVRHVGGLKELLDARTKALEKLERTWVSWLGNPTTAEGYDPDAIHLAASTAAESGMPATMLGALQDNPSNGDLETAPLLSHNDPSRSIVAPGNRPRPTLRAQPYNPFSRRLDAIDELTRRLALLDKAVRNRRKGAFVATGTGFVTFEDAGSAQIASQTVLYPVPSTALTNLAPEPRDIVWRNVALSTHERRVRQLLVTAFMVTLLLFWGVPVTFLASFLSYQAIRQYAPWLAKLLDRNERLRALVQTSLPSIVLIAFNALLPLLLEWASYLQGIKARSLVEYSVLKKYFLFLLVNVVFIFIITSTAWGVLADLANNPMRIVDKLAHSLPGARHFFLSYVILQGLAIMPVQLLQLPTITIRAFYRIFYTRTPREHAEINAPPTLAMGTVYPQALLVFTICILYSVVSPLICVFGAIYFGIGYVVFKYKLLFVFYKSYESKGQAWPLSATRCIWALALFQLFMTSLFSVRKQFFLSILMTPLLVFTIWFGHYLSKTFDPLSTHVNLSSIREVQRGGAEAAANALLRLRDGEGDRVRPEQASLAKRRYAAADETLFVAQRDSKTDYREPPQSDYFPGVLNTGRRRYGHPAITGILPELWLPIKASVEDSTLTASDGGAQGAQGLRRSPSYKPKVEPLVLSLRRRKSSLKLRRPGLGLNRSESSAGALARSGTRDGLVAGESRVSLLENVGGTEGEREEAGAEDVARVWSDGVSGPQGSSGAAAFGEVLSGPQAVAPVRKLVHNQDEQGEGQEEGEEGERDEQGLEEEDEAEEEGVYMHRSATRRDFPGAFPGYRDEE